MGLPGWFLSMVGAFSSAVADKLSHDAVDTLEAFTTFALSAWKGTGLQKNKINSIATSREVLGSNGGLKRNHYAYSPTLKYIKERCTLNGVMYVMYVPSAGGKTSACFATMEKYATATTGVCFSGSDYAGSYYKRFMSLLGLDYQNPPEGWMNCFVDAIEFSQRGKHSFLLLDDFMTNGWNEVDQALLSLLKTAIRGKNIVGVVLTANREAANMMLSFNDLEGIRPLATFQGMAEIRKTHKPITRGIPIPLDWDKYVSMEWDGGNLKVAALEDPQYRDLSDGEKEMLKATIDEYLDELDPQERKEINPSRVLQYLRERTDILRTITTSPKSANPTSPTSTGTITIVSRGGCGCDANCPIM